MTTTTSPCPHRITLMKTKSKAFGAAAAVDHTMITTPNPYDILCGRGNGVNNTPGNIQFRKLIELHRPTYVVAARRHKAQIAKMVMDIVHANGGRFLRLDEAKNCWVEIRREKALEKTCQALREDAHNIKRSPSPQSTQRLAYARRITNNPKKTSKASSSSNSILRHPTSVQTNLLKKSGRPKIDMRLDAQMARNKFLDSLRKEEHLKRQQREREARKARTQELKNEHETKIKNSTHDRLSPARPATTPTINPVPKHRLMFLPNTKPSTDDSNIADSIIEGISSPSMDVKTSPGEETMGVSHLLGFPWFKEEEWEDMFSQLVAFKKITGHCAVPPGWNENPWLAEWASYQRQIKREVSDYRSATTVEQTRLDRLDVLGFVWDYDAWHFDRRYNEFLQIAKDNPGATTLGSAVLEHWIRDQRTRYRDGLFGRYQLMRPDRVLMLQKGDFKWDGDVPL